MVIYSHKHYIVNIVGLGVIVSLVCALFLSLGAVLLAILLLIISVLLLTSYGVAVGRTITYGKDGCTISIGKIKKVITWKNISIKQIEPGHFGLRNQYHDGGVFFSINKVYKPQWCDPCLYCMLFHPISCFWVYFSPKTAKPDVIHTQGIYEVNESIFLNQLRSWGVELSG